MKKKKIIGRLDKVDLPDLAIAGIRAKVDTGAYTSAIHCQDIRLKDTVLSFYIPIEVAGEEVMKKFQTKNYYQKSIKSSNGAVSLRYVIKTRIILFGKAYTTEFSLSDRSKMKNPVLIGRKLLKGKFIVDVSKKNLSFDFSKEPV